MSNPPLAEAVSDAIGDRWITDPSQLSRLKRLAKNKRFQNAIRKAKRASKAELAAWIERTTGREIDPDSIFDSQAQPIGGSNRQLLNALRIAAQYQRFVANPKLADARARSSSLGKPRPATGRAARREAPPSPRGGDRRRSQRFRGRMKVVVIPDSRVSTVARVLAASDVSNSISTAGHGGNGMPAVAAAMNGALTVGSRDGVVLDIAQAAGPENVVLFGLTAEEMAADASTFDPMWHFENEAEARAAFELLASERFHGGDSALFAPIAELLLQRADRHRHLADLKSFCDAHRRVGELHGNRDAWYRKVVSNLAAAGTLERSRRRDLCQVKLGERRSARFRSDPPHRVSRAANSTLVATAAALTGFAANSLLCRMALGAGAIDAWTFTAVRLGSGAIVLLLLARARTGAQPLLRAGSWPSALALLV